MDIHSGYLPPHLVIISGVRSIQYLRAICAFFLVIGFFMMFSGELQTIFAGILVILFGLVGLIACQLHANGSYRSIITYQGFTRYSAYGSEVVYWEDVESVGVCQSMLNKMVGIRMRTYERSLRMSKPNARILTALKFVAWFCSFLPVGLPLKIWFKVEGRGSPSKMLREFAKSNVQRLDVIWMWNRKWFDYDILLPWSELDRSPDKFLNLLNQYLSAYGKRISN